MNREVKITIALALSLLASFSSMGYAFYKVQELHNAMTPEQVCAWQRTSNQTEFCKYTIKAVKL